MSVTRDYCIVGPLRRVFSVTKEVERTDPTGPQELTTSAHQACHQHYLCFFTSNRHSMLPSSVLSQFVGSEFTTV